MLSTSTIHLAFLFCCVGSGFLLLVERRNAKRTVVVNMSFQQFQQTYLFGYLVAMLADWLQGPYVYALYASYGYSAEDNATLFVAGFGSSMVFGTIVGSLADRTGRKRAIMIYCALYIASCLTKHVSWFPMLMLGRITGGIATSLLFSVFESWLVCEHHARQFSPELLGDTFGLAIFGNSIVAIVAGFIAQAAADATPLTPPMDSGASVHFGGYCAPFDVSICCLVICGVLVIPWPENYGSRDKETVGASSTLSNLVDTTRVIFNRVEILCCGLVVSFFESAMFIFVFQWTPAVSEPGAPNPPYGTIFATFMVACMLGSRIFNFARKVISLEKVGQWLLFVAAVAHAVPATVSDPTLCFLAFITFEVCVGVYFPMMFTLKSEIVPETSRSTIYNLFRVPLNVLVVGSLLAKFNVGTAFAFTSALLLIAFVAQGVLVRHRSSVKSAGSAMKSHDVTELESELDDTTLSFLKGV